MTVAIYYLKLIKPEQTDLVILFPIVLLVRTAGNLQFPSGAETERKQRKHKNWSSVVVHSGS